MPEYRFSVIVAASPGTHEEILDAADALGTRDAPMRLFVDTLKVWNYYLSGQPIPWRRPLPLRYRTSKVAATGFHVSNWNATRCCRRPDAQTIT